MDATGWGWKSRFRKASSFFIAPSTPPPLPPPVNQNNTERGKKVTNRGFRTQDQEATHEVDKGTRNTVQRIEKEEGLLGKKGIKFGRVCNL